MDDRSPASRDHGGGHAGSNVNRVFRLRRRPADSLETDDFDLVEESVPEVRDGQALVQTLWLSIDPSNWIWMSDVEYGLPPVAVGNVMRAFGIGQVVESRRDDLNAGDLVYGLTGWAEYAIADDEANELPFRRLDTPPPGVPLSWLLGPLGHPGVTAYLGLHDIGKPQPGETMVVSTAAGAVGSAAGQIGKARGARVVGITGSTEKCRYVVEELGFDAAVNYKDPDWTWQLDEALPDGVDVDFENVGGEIIERVVARLNVGARVVLCGLMSDYKRMGSSAEKQSRIDLSQILVNRALVGSFLVLDHANRFPEAIEYLADLVRVGKLRHRETVVEGLERAPEALSQMFAGSNIGKLLVKVAGEAWRS
jgi:NADPH-dependent curcumin reductase CurA